MPGLPWWAAVVLATGATAIGLVLDIGSGGKELTNVFAALYVLGCVAAVLAVRQSGVFTAVIQPPLILFVAVPGAYWLFHGTTFTGIKGILINCGYPLIERFPLMLFTSAGVLLIGMVRWYFATATPATSATPQTPAAPGAPRTAVAPAGPGRLAALAAKLAGRLGSGRDPGEAGEPTAPPRRRGTAAAPRSTPTHSRHPRPRMSEAAGTAAANPRRRRPPYAGPEEPPRRRPRPPQDIPGYRTGRPAARDPYRPGEPPEPRPRPRQTPRNAAGNPPNGTHHPVSRVRYRGANPGDGSRAESWGYDI